MRQRRWIYLIVLPVLTLGLFALFFGALRDLLRTAFLTPLVTGYYILRFYFSRFSQALLWGGFMIAASILLARLYLNVLRSTSTSRRWTIPSPRPQNALEEMAKDIRRAQRHPFYRRKLACYLMEIAIPMIARKDAISLNEARSRVECETGATLPVGLHFFLYRKRRHGLGNGHDFHEKLRETLVLLEHYPKQGG